MDDDLDEFIALITNQSVRFYLCRNPNWLGRFNKKESSCPFVLSNDANLGSDHSCSTCKRSFTICDCGGGLDIWDGKTKLCVLVPTIDSATPIRCPKLDKE